MPRAKRLRQTDTRCAEYAHFYRNLSKNSFRVRGRVKIVKIVYFHHRSRSINRNGRVNL